MKITTLIENTSKDHLHSEHGLSFFITFEGKNYLLDAGQTSKFIENANMLKIDLNTVECAFLSHAHYDHGDGYKSFLEKKIYTTKYFDQKYYSKSGGNLHYIGLDEALLTTYKDLFIPVEKAYFINDKIMLLPHTTTGLERVAKKAKLYVLEKESLVYDDFKHEMSVIFDTEKGLVVFNSCAHSGLKVIIEEVKNMYPNKKIYAFIGGLHMKGKQDGKEICTFREEEIKDLCDYIKESGITYIYTGHCTGEIAFLKMKEYLNDTLQRLYSGKEINI